MEKKYIELINTQDARDILGYLPLKEEFLLICPNMKDGNPGEGVMVRAGQIEWDKEILNHDYGIAYYMLLLQAAEEIPQFRKILINAAKALQSDKTD